MSIHRLLTLFERARAANDALVLATVIRTGGSTYAKPGAQMLIAADGEYAGLLSGGCLEGDLREHAREVSATGAARIVSYDMRSTHDQLFGLGAGCEGAMDVLLIRVDAGSDWQPLQWIASAAHYGDECRLAFVTASEDPRFPLGLCFPDTGAPGTDRETDPGFPALRAAAANTAGNDLPRVAAGSIELFVAALAPPPRLLLLGGGPDARPVASLAAFLGWRITIVDHRSGNLAPERFPPGTELIETHPTEVARAVHLERYPAAVVMSHHLDSDLQYLRALCQADIPYVGLLGPAARREKLLADLGEDAGRLRPRLRAPVGLDIGGRSPESIALSIVGEVHAAVFGRAGRPFSETAG